jgi:hypothetical protein
MASDKAGGAEIGMACGYGQHNNSFNASGNSAAFIRETWMLVSLCTAMSIRALDILTNFK